MWRRFGFAIIGGLSIVTPMLIIVTNTAPVKTVAIDSASVLIFSVAVALFSSLLPENVLAATVAYATVLMVFIGFQNCGYWEGSLRRFHYVL